MKLIIDMSDEVYEDIKYRFFEKHDYNNGYLIASSIVYGTPLKEELEQIKTEIRNKKDGYGRYPVCDNCIKIIDKHISELSEDNKQNRCNSCLNNTDELSGECYECVKGIEDWYEPISELKVNKPTCNNSECIEFDCEFYENNNSTRYGYCWASGCCTNEIDFDEVKGNKE